jgi:hypothetical protein
MNARDLATRLSDLLRREHEAMAEFLLALADFDRRRAWEELGYSSLFMFLHRQLRLSKGAASYRASAAALIQRIPEVVEPLRDGRMCLSTIFEVAKVLTPENRAEVLPRFFHRSKDEARELVAELMPAERPPARTMIVPVRSAAASTPPRVAAETDSSASAQSDPSATATGWPADLLDAKTPAQPVNAPLVRPRGAPFEPLTGDLFRMHLTVPKRLEEKLEAARDALSHSHPGATRNSAIASCSRRRRSERRVARSRAFMSEASHAISRAPETHEDATPREIGPAACAEGRSAERAATRPRSAALGAISRDGLPRSALEPKPRPAIRWVPSNATAAARSTPSERRRPRRRTGFLRADPR